MAATNTIGIVRVAFLAAGTGGVPDATITSTLRADQIGCGLGELIGGSRQPVIDADVLPFDVSELAQSLQKAGDEGVGRWTVA
jgi:hypothetical protein